LRQVRERGVRRPGLKAAVERDLPRPDPEPVELGDGVGQQPVL
jgi:hypothetical protein